MYLSILLAASVDVHWQTLDYWYAPSAQVGKGGPGGMVRRDGLNGGGDGRNGRRLLWAGADRVTPICKPPVTAMAFWFPLPRYGQFLLL